MNADTLGNQIATVQAAPLPFVLILLGLAGIIWGVVNFVYKERIDTLKHRLEARDDELTRQHPKGATAARSPRTLSMRSGTSRKPKPPSHTAPRIFVGSSVTPAYLASFYVNRTRVEGDNALAAYVGKWLSVCGTVRDVKEYSRDAQLLINTELSEGQNYPTGVSLTFSSLEQIGGFRIGDRVCAIGRIDMGSDASITLEDCEIVVGDRGQTGG